MPENEAEGSGGREARGGDPRLPHPLAAALGPQHGHRLLPGPPTAPLLALPHAPP